MSARNDDAIERLLREKKATEAYFTSIIQDAAGETPIRRAPMTGPNWPVRADYPNRKQYLAACAQWRRSPQ
jgi:hypothetical protein